MDDLPKYGEKLLSLEIPFPTSVNAMYANNSYNYNAKRGRYKSQKYQKWQKLAVAGFLTQRMPLKPIDKPLMVVIRLHRPDKRKRDVANFEKAVTDTLTMQKIISDDSIIIDNRQLWHEENKNIIDIYEVSNV